MNRTESFIAMAALGVVFDVTDPQGVEALVNIGAVAILFVRWFNAVRAENKP